MKGFLIAIVGFCLSACFATPATAQSTQVGSCQDTFGPLHIVETVRHFPGGSWDKVTQFVRPGPYGPQQVYDSIPDASGIHLMQIRSAAAGVAFWLTRNGDLLATNHMGWRVVGSCSYQIAWASQFPPPAYLPIQQTVPFDVDALASMPTTLMANGARIPTGIFQPGVFPGIPRLMSLTQAKECYERSGADKEELFLCATEKAMGSKERAIVECVRSANGDQISAGLCLLGNNLSADQKKAVQDMAACYKANGTNWNEYPVCMASKQADPQTARLINCARQQMQQGQQPDYWTMGYCAFGQSFLNPNPETAIAIQCAIYTRGQPGPFIACAGGQLLYRELQKCLDGSIDDIGRDDGCFGKNNSLTKVYDRIEEELGQALGKNSVAFQAWKTARLSMDPHKMADAFHKVRSELNKAIAQGSGAVKAAGENALEWVDAATPDITVSGKGIKIEGIKVGQIGKGLKCCKF